MANYEVSIKLAVAGAKELERVNKRTEQLRKNIDHINKTAQEGTANRPAVRNFKNLSKAVGEARDALDEAAIGTKEFNQAVKHLVQVENKYERQLKQKERRLQIQRLAQKESISLSKAKKLLIEQERIAEEKLAASKQKTANAEQRKRIGGTISSAMIGGAFPLLFGQTGAAAVGGGLGGLAGGAIGGQFGFALSILGTAIGSYIQQQDELDRSLLKISNSFITAGDSAGFTRESFKELKTVTKMTKDEVLSVASAFARYGETGKAAAFIFGDNPNTFKNLAAMRDTKTLMTAILDEQNGLNISQQIQLLREAKITSFKDMQLKVNRLILEENYKRELIEARQISRVDKLLDLTKQYYKLLLLTQGFQPFSVLEKSFKGIFQKDKLKKELQVVENLVETAFPKIFNTSAENAEDAANKITEYYNKLFEKLPEVQKLISELNAGVVAMSYSIPGALDSVSAELKKLMSVGYMVTTVANTVGDAFGESFKGIVKGSMSAQQALTNLFNKTADAFLDMAAKMIAEQIKLKILGIGLHFLGGQTKTIRGVSTGSGLNALDFDDPGYEALPAKANGGAVRGGSSYLVGERGPELFSPGVSGMITPNEMLGGSTNIVVNVDASGTSVQGDEPSGEELGRLIGAVVQSELIKEKRPGGLLA